MQKRQKKQEEHWRTLSVASSIKLECEILRYTPVYKANSVNNHLSNLHRSEPFFVLIEVFKFLSPHSPYS